MIYHYQHEAEASEFCSKSTRLRFVLVFYFPAAA
jgi:hypothetical protein